jgi:hypothetical protein
MSKGEQIDKKTENRSKRCWCWLRNCELRSRNEVEISYIGKQTLERRRIMVSEEGPADDSRTRINIRDVSCQNVMNCLFQKKILAPSNCLDKAPKKRMSKSVDASSLTRAVTNPR